MADHPNQPLPRLALFLAQYWGGPHTYLEERGHPRLRMRHLPFHIGPLERDRWLVHMAAAVDTVCAERGEPSEVREDYLLYKRDRFIMTEERILSALAAEGLYPSRQSLADYFRAAAVNGAKGASPGRRSAGGLASG